jgi:hypothetical protein
VGEVESGAFLPTGNAFVLVSGDALVHSHLTIQVAAAESSKGSLSDVAYKAEEVSSGAGNDGG